MAKSLYTAIKDTTPPTTATVGIVGQCYINSTEQKYYVCTNADTTNNVYTWQELGGAINLYRQHYWFDDSNGKRHAFDILTKTTTQIISDIASLKKYLNDNGYSSSTIILPFTMSTPSGAGNINYYTGIYSSSDILYAIGIGLNITTDSGTVTNVSFQTTSSAISFSTLHFTGYETITDTVVTV